MLRSTYASAALLALLVLPGCVSMGGDPRRIESAGETRHESVTIDRARASGAERVDVHLDLNAGELTVNGGASKLLEADFDYNVASWKPEVRFDRSGFRGTLLVKQGGHAGTFGDAKNTWHLRLADQIPMNFMLNCGAGENRLFLGDLDLRDVEVNIGAGRVELDLRGTPPMHDYSVRVNGGVGQADVELPADTSIVASATGGLGQISVTGLEKRDGEWRNNVRNNKATIRVEVHGGIGQIRINAG